MNGLKSFKKQLKYVNKDSFGNFALELFNYQYNNNPVYREYVEETGVVPQKVGRPEDIPFNRLCEAGRSVRGARRGRGPANSASESRSDGGSGRNSG